MKLLLLLSSAALAAEAALDLFATGVTLHSPAAASDTLGLRGHPASPAAPHPLKDSLVYIRCSPTSAVDGEDHAGTVDRSHGLHAALPVEEVSAAPIPELDGLNLYTLGNWADVANAAPLACELHDPYEAIAAVHAGPEAAASATPRHGAALLRVSDFGASHRVSVKMMVAGQDGAEHAATVSFVCPLCAFGGSGDTEQVSRIWAAKFEADHDLAAADGAVTSDPSSQPGGAMDDLVAMEMEAHDALSRAFRNAQRYGTFDPTVPTLAALQLAMSWSQRFGLPLAVSWQAGKEVRIGEDPPSAASVDVTAAATVAAAVFTAFAFAAALCLSVAAACVRRSRAQRAASAAEEDGAVAAKSFVTGWIGKPLKRKVSDYPIGLGGSSSESATLLPNAALIPDIAV